MQIIAARWVTSRENSVSSIKHLKTYLKARNPTPRPIYITATITTHLTRFQHPFHFNIPTANHYHDWNLLPIAISAIAASTLNCFKNQLLKCIIRPGKVDSQFIVQKSMRAGGHYSLFIVDL